MTLLLGWNRLKANVLRFKFLSNVVLLVAGVKLLHHHTRISCLPACTNLAVRNNLWCEPKHLAFGSIQLSHVHYRHL